MWFTLVGLMIQNLYAQPIPDEVEVGASIIVEARKNMVVFVEDPTITNTSEKIISDFNSDSIVGYVNSHARLGKVKNLRGTYEPVTMHTEKIEVYDSRTIEYAYSDCNYKKDSLACAIQNDHYLVRTHISINDREVVVRMTLYNSNALIVNSSSYSSREIVAWIKQQEVNVTSTSEPAGTQTLAGGTNNCTDNSCSTISQTQQLSITTTTTNMPKEELPLRFSIPPRLVDKNLHQASLGLFVGVKLD